MIFGSLNETNLSEIGHEGVRRAIEYARTHDLLSLEPGRHDIDGDALYANVSEYTTKLFDECAFEAHKRYIDVQMILSGEERIDCQFVGKLAAGDFNEADDFMLLEGEAGAACTMVPGTFVVCFPEDGHKPGIAVGEPAPVKKAVFKVLV